MKKQYIKYAVAAIISCITVIVYFRTLQNEFVDWDDGRYVFENPNIRSFDLTLFKWAFLDFYEANWHPLTWLSHALDYAIWGLNPLGHHLTNNVLHAVNTFIVVLLVVRLLEAAEFFSPPREKEGSPFPFHVSRFTLIAAATTGLVFGLHPIHVESVAWAAERKDLLCALFFLLSIMMYMNYVGGWKTANDGQKGKLFRNGHYLLSLGLFTLALLSKPMAVTLPVVLLIVDWYPFNRIQSMKSFRSVCIEKLPFIVLSLLSSILTIMAQTGAIQSLELIPFSSRLLVATKSIIAYLGKMVFPAKLLPFYVYPRDASLFSLEYLSVIVLVIMITAACIIMAKKQKLFLSIWGYYVVTLVPVLGIVQVGGQAMADRYMYLPSFGPSLLIGLLVARVMSSPTTLVKLVGAALALLACITLAYLTFEQIGIWRSNLDLWGYVIEKDPGKVPIAYKNRGTAYDRRGRLYEAIQDYDTAIALGLKDAQIFNNRGLVYLKLGQVERAIPDFKKACELGDSFGCNAPKYLFNQ